jgi:hypothetical protein
MQLLHGHFLCLKSLVCLSIVPFLMLDSSRYIRMNSSTIDLIHSHLRMNCSNLKAHLHFLYGEDNPQCICISGIEDCFSLFFSSFSLYLVERVKLFHSVHQLCNISLDSLLYGDESIDVNMNLELFSYVENFIYETGRFV